MKNLAGAPRARHAARGRDAQGGSIILDRLGTVLGFDQGLEELTGWPAMEVVGRHKDLGCLVDGDKDGSSFVTVPLYEGGILMPSSGTRSRELRLHGRDGSTILVDVLVQRLRGPGERMLVKVLRVLAQTPAPVTVETMAGCDDLTGLLDRTGFLHQLEEDFERAAATAAPLALIVADVDRLRNVGDRLGFDEQQLVLRKLSGILRVTVDDDERLGRLGDDDFGILLPGAGRGDARQLAAGLRTTVERFRFFDLDKEAATEAPPITLSIGAASFPADADNPCGLLDRAYEALDEARALGRNRVWCYLRRPRVPLEVPVYFDAIESPLVGFSRDLSPSGIFVQTGETIDIGMRCALAFPLPGSESRVHVIGRVVRSVPPASTEDVRIPGMGVEFERFGGPADRRAIENYLHVNEARTLRPENGILSIPD